MAESNESLRSAHASALSAEGYLVSVATDGSEALEVIARTKPDLVLLDLGLPGVSGWDILSSLQTIADWCDIDVITISAGISPSVMAAAWRHGCSWSMTRQVSLNDLLLVVRCLLGSRRARQARRDALPVQCPRTRPRETPMALAPTL